MSDELKKFLKWWALACVCLLFLNIGAIIGRHQAEDWSATKYHRDVRLEGYQYCPYCGELLEEDGE